MSKRYGITQAALKEYREHLKSGSTHDYLMQQLAQTYRTRRAMYTITHHNR